VRVAATAVARDRGQSAGRSAAPLLLVTLVFSNLPKEALVRQPLILLANLVLLPSLQCLGGQGLSQDHRRLSSEFVSTDSLSARDVSDANPRIAMALTLS